MLFIKISIFKFIYYIGVRFEKSKANIYPCVIDYSADVHSVVMPG
jgi:hypothetical protein